MTAIAGERVSGEPGLRDVLLQSISDTARGAAIPASVPARVVCERAPAEWGS